MWCCGYIPSVSQNPIWCWVFLLPRPRIGKSKVDDGEGERKKRKRKIKMKIKWAKLKDESWKTVENDGGDGIDRAFRWKHRTQRWKKRKSTYDTQSLRNITLSSYWAITLPRAVISVRVEKVCVCVWEDDILSWISVARNISQKRNLCF